MDFLLVLMDVLFTERRNIQILRTSEKKLDNGVKLYLGNTLTLSEI